MAAPDLSHRAASPRLIEWAAVAVVLLWGAYQCFWNLGGHNISADEPIYADAGWDYLHGDTTANLEHPPFAKYLMGLAQLVLGQGLVPARVAAALAVFGTGVLLYVWLRREIGWIGALSAAGFWLLLPHGSSNTVRLDRLALLEPFMVFFAVGAFAAAWQWYRRRPGTGHRIAPWVWLAVAAVSMAFSVTSKVSSAVLAPALLLVIVLGRRWPTALLGAVVFGAVALVTALLVYLPVHPVEAIDYMLRFQAAHDAVGHPVEVAGVAYPFPPWWANLWFSVAGMGVATTIVLVAGSVAALWSRRWALLSVMAVAVGGLWVFYLIVSNVALNHYYYSWVWPFCVLAGIGVSVLLAAKPSRLVTDLGRISGTLLLALALVCASWASIEIARERPAGMQLVVGELESLGIDRGDILVAGMSEWEYTYVLDGRQTLDPADPDIVAYALKDQVRFPIDPVLAETLRSRAGELDRYTIDDVTLYVVRAASASERDGANTQ